MDRNSPLLLTRPVAVNTGLTLPRSPWGKNSCSNRAAAFACRTHLQL